MSDPLSETLAAVAAANETGAWEELDGKALAAKARFAVAIETYRIASLVAAVFNTPQGQELLAWLKKRIVDPPSYREGDSFDRVAFREGQKDVIRQLEANIELARKGPPQPPQQEA